MALRRLGGPSSETCNTVTLRTDQLLVQHNDLRCSVSQLPYVIPTTPLNVAHLLHCKSSDSTANSLLPPSNEFRNSVSSKIGLLHCQHLRTAISTSSPLCKRSPSKRYCSGPNYRVDSSEVPNETTTISCVRSALCGGPLS